MKNTSIHLNQHANSISVDPRGCWTVLGARKGLCFVNLEKPKEKPKLISLNTKHEISVVKWSPLQPERVVYSYNNDHSNHIVQVCDVDHSSATSSVVATLKGHKKNVTDVGWSPSDSNLLATCSADAFILLWDTRIDKNEKPVRIFSAHATSSQLRWNPNNNNIIASAHEGEVKLWDTRKESTNCSFITAHMNTILSLDWSIQNADELVTCGLDRYIKLWNCNKPTECERFITTAHAVSRGRYLPFGSGLVTVSQNADFQVRVWSLVGGGITNINVLHGHTDIIKSFDFRVIKDDYQLVTWSRDQTLRIWNFSGEVHEDCGHIKPDLLASSLDTSEMTDPSIKQIIKGTPPFSYYLECKQVEKEFKDKVRIEYIKAHDRSCIFEINVYTISKAQIQLRLLVSFPVLYPHAMPSFQIISSSALLSVQETKNLKEILTSAAESCQSNSKGCLGLAFYRMIESLEKQLIYLETKPLPSVSSSSSLSSSTLSKNQKTISTEMESLSSSSSQSSTSIIGTMNNKESFYQQGKKQARLPVPRTCGATFSASGELIYFKNFVFNSPHISKHPPRTYDALRKARTPIGRKNVESKDYFSSFFVTSDLYGNSEKLQHRNQDSISLPHDSAPTSLSADSAEHLRQEKIDTRVHIYDTKFMLPFSYGLANMLQVSGDLKSICEHNKSLYLKSNNKILANVWDIVCNIVDWTVCTTSNHLEPWAMHPFGRKMMESILNFYLRKRDLQTVAILSCVLEIPFLMKRKDFEYKEEYYLIDRKKRHIFDHIRKMYSEILHFWGFDCAKNEIMKFVQARDECHEQSQLGIVLQNNIHCSICHLPVKGLCMYCINCQHGGHLNHLRSWFSKHKQCPTGCGCSCLLYLESFLREKKSSKSNQYLGSNADVEYYHHHGNSVVNISPPSSVQSSNNNPASTSISNVVHSRSSSFSSNTTSSSTQSLTPSHHSIHGNLNQIASCNVSSHQKATSLSYGQNTPITSSTPLSINPQSSKKSTQSQSLQTQSFLNFLSFSNK